MTVPGPTLETERLILRPPSPDDLDGFVAMAADPDVARFIGGVQAPSQAWRQMCGIAGAWSLYGYGMFSVIEKETGNWIGRLGPWRPLDWPGPEVGWGLVRSTWGKGYATEGAAATIDWAFEHLGWTEVIHTIDAGNFGSVRVAERLGSRLMGKGRLPPPYEANEVDVWGQTREQWRARKASRSTP